MLKEYDVICIGAGGAGIAAAAAAASLGAAVAVLSKEPIGQGNTGISGGIMTNPGFSPGDGIEQFKRDLLRSGEQLNDPRIVSTVAEHAGEATGVLEGFGLLFGRDEQGNLSGDSVIAQGGHSFPRTLSVGVAKGMALANAVRAGASRSTIDVFEEFVVARLIVREGRVDGAAGFSLLTGEPFAFAARAVILATGGYPWIFYPHTDATRSTIGDGYALAYSAGAELVNMECFQCGTEPTFSGPLARLTNAQGEVVREAVGLITRAELSRLIALEVAKGKATPGGGIFVDPRPNLESPEGLEFYRKMKSSGVLDALVGRRGPRACRWEEPWEIRTRAHFTLGGVRIDEWGRTRVDGLYAAGEVADGLHGANRLGSVALTEIFVMGTRAGLDAARRIPRADVPLDFDPEPELAAIDSLFGRQGAHKPVKLIRRLQKVMWDRVGPARTRDLCLQAIAEIEEIAADAKDLSVSDLRVYNGQALDAVELGYMLVVSRAIARGALEREETRGSHLRLDFRERREAAENMVVWERDGRMAFRREPAAKPGAEEARP